MVWFVSILIAMPSFVFAQTQSAASSQRITPTPGTNGDGNRPTAPNFSFAPNQDINGGAKQASGGEGAAMGVSFGAAAVFLGICVGTTGNEWACPMAAMSALQGVMMAASGSGSDKTAAASQAIPTGSYNSPDPGTNPDPSGSANLASAGTPGSFTSAKKMLDQLSGLGYTIDPKTGVVTTPNGTLSASDFSSPASMAAAGFSPAQIGAAQKALEEINSKYSKDSAAKVTPVAVGSGSGGYDYNANSKNSKDPFSKYFKSLREPASTKAVGVAGKTVLLSGEPIGAKGDNIFDMIHRRYQAKERMHEFITNENGDH